jgi:hypothetical protein
MDKFESYASLRATEWAAWARRAGEGVGWPPETLLSRVIREGASGASQGGKIPISMPDQVAEVDREVCRMPPHIRAAFCEHYMTYAASEVKARKLGISRSVFWLRVKAGNWFLYSALQVAA